MFSFFKFLQNTLKSLKAKKGLWFTLLGVFSVLGIFGSIYVLSSMTENVSKEVYSSISTNYNKDYKNRIFKKEEVLKKVLLSIKANESLISNIKTNNLVSIQDNLNIYNQSFKKTGFDSLNVSFYPVFNQINQYRASINATIASKQKAFGIEVLLDGIYFVYLEPIMQDNTLIGVLELKEELHSLKLDYSKNDMIFLFMIEEGMLNKLSIKSRNGNYREIIDSLHVEELKYSSQFYADIVEAGKEDFKNMFEVGYSVDSKYFRTSQKVSDINGNIIGVIVIGETVTDTGAFVNIVDNMTKTVTTVALGLVISILLFMF